MQVRNINEPHARKVAAVLRELLRKADAGRLSSLEFIAEEEGRKQPLEGIVGRFRQDPHRVIGHLEVMKTKLAGFAVEQEQDFEDSQDFGESRL